MFLDKDSEFCYTSNEFCYTSNEVCYWPWFMDESGTQSLGTVQWDASHHHMASWDDHPACRSCLNKMGIFCSESEPCDVQADRSDSEAARPQSADVIGPRASNQPRVAARPQCKDWSKPWVFDSRLRGLEARTRQGLAGPRPGLDSRLWIEDRARPRARTELQPVVRPLTIVNSRPHAREVERIVPV